MCEYKNTGKNMPRTDLALDAADFLRSKFYEEAAEENRLPEGIHLETEENGVVKLTKIKVESENGSKRIGKPQGTYITLEIPEIATFESQDYEQVSRTISDMLSEVCDLKKGQSTLVVGLGNWNITADSLGPKTVSKVFVSRHLLQYLPEGMDSRVNPVSAISPGVLGITGIETGEIICGIAEKMKPDLIIAVDALASGKVQRVNSTIQIANTGISPGSGLGNNRMKLSEETLGVPVIAVGVPTVVDAVTFTGDAIDKLSEKTGANMLSNMVRDGNYGTLREYFDEDFNDLVVTPKNIDNVMDRLSGVIATGINLSLHRGMTLEEINNIMI